MTEGKKLNIDDTLYETSVPDSYGPSWSSPDEKQIRAFIPGTIIEVQVSMAPG